MDEADAQRTFDEVQREKAELGIPVEPEAQSTDTVEPAAVAKEETVVEPEPVSAKEVIPPKEYKEIKENLRAELQKDFDEKLAKIKEESEKAKPSEVKTNILEEDVQNLAKELDFDPEKVKKIIEVARKGLEMNAEDKQALEEFKNSKAEREAKQQEEIFNEEWNGLPVKTQFPNASEEQIAKAKETMDELAHSEKYHEMDMDYILFKEKETFDKILFSPKMHTFESGRLPPSNDESNEWPEIKPNMTPAEIEKLEKQRERIMANEGSEKMLIRSTDEGGRITERWE
jgi:hypothetical protein